MTRALCSLTLTGIFIAGLAIPALAQDPQSTGLARQLAEQLSARKLGSFAARMPDGGDEFAAVLAFPGQMIVVWAKFSAPAVLNERLINKEYREVYIDLNSASDPESRHMVTDIGADGIRRGERNQPADAYDVGSKSTLFDGSWREDKMSEDDYDKAHADADAVYTKVLGVLIEELKKAS